MDGQDERGGADRQRRRGGGPDDVAARPAARRAAGAGHRRRAEQRPRRQRVADGHGAARERAVRAAAARGTRRPGTPPPGPRAGRPYSAPPRAPRRRPGCARRPRPSRPLPGHRIAIDARAAARPELGGVERWARELARACPRCGPAATRSSRRRPRLVHRAGHAWEQLVLPLRAARARALLCPANLAPLAFPRNVIVIHDAAALRHPEWYSPAYAAWQRRILPALARRALHVVTVSEFSRGELAELVGLDPDRVTVIPGGVDARLHPAGRRGARPAARWAPRPYVLCVASQTARKNLRALVPLAGSRSTSSSPAGTGRSSRASRGSTACATSARCPSAAPRPLRGRGRVRAPLPLRGVRPARAGGDGVRHARRRHQRHRAPGDRRRSGAPGRARSDSGGGRAALLGDPAERERLRAAGLARAASFTWSGPPARSTRCSAASRRAARRNTPSERAVTSRSPRWRRSPDQSNGSATPRARATCTRPPAGSSAACAPSPAATAPLEPRRLAPLRRDEARRALGLALRRRPRQLGQPHRLAPVAERRISRRANSIRRMTLRGRPV